MEEEKALKADQKHRAAELEAHTIDAIRNMTDDQITNMLQLKWVAPICDALEAMPTEILDGLESKVQHLVEKYAVTFAQTEQNIRKAESSLSEMMGQLTGSLSDLQGIAELQKLFK